MKSSFVAFLGLLLCVAASATEVDPRIAPILRAELSTTQRFCFTFAADPVRNGLQVANDCVGFASYRFSANQSIADKNPGAGQMGIGVSQAQGAFCGSIGQYSGPGSWLGEDCESWNRARAELFRLGTTAGTTADDLRQQIERTETGRLRFCQSLLAAGNPGDTSVFASRISACFALVKQASASDRAVLLGDFSP